ncbi:MAG TPA: tripartite tricarboxylate transporter substrate binding protein [Paenalcaligenes sp.]|nr:tripartite tricarboxylate transporter substrate binding protein [Paenalcaligenes sp.]
MSNIGRIRSAILGSVLGLGAVLASQPALAADDWPNKPIEVIVPYTPGGSTDTVARFVMKELEERLGQPIIIQNRPGANSTIGTAQATRAKPDGYTFLMILAAYAVNPHLYDLNYSLDQLTPVSYIADLPLFLFVSNSVPADNLEELIEYGKENPGALTFGSSGVGASAHLTGESFGLRTGTELVHIPYNGSAPILTDLVNGEVSMVFDPILIPMPYAKEGRIKVFAITSPERWPDEPDIPTMAEAGLPDFNMSSWAGLMAPTGTPDDIIERISAEIADIVQDPKIIQQFHQAGFVPVGGSPADLDELIKTDTQMYGEIIEKANVTIN